MMFELQTTIAAAGGIFFDWFVLPGEFTLAQIRNLSPTFAETAGFGDRDDQLTLTVALSLLVWTLPVAVFLKILKQFRILGTRLKTGCNALLFRCSLFLHNIKRSVTSPVRKFFQWRRSRYIETATVEFDDLDMAVLGLASAQPPGFAVSAPELAEQLNMRPAQIQRCLDRLIHYNMLEYVIGSTEGFDNYRVTLSGSAFVTTMN